MTVGLDIGSTGFRSVRMEGRQLKARSCKAIYALVPDEPAHRHLLHQMGATLYPCGDEQIVIGESADEYARLTNRDVVPLLIEGKLPHDDFLTRQVLVAVLEALLPAAFGDGSSPSSLLSPDREVCCLTLPAVQTASSPAPEGLPATNGQARQQAIAYFAQVLKLRGYRPIVVGQGLAVGLAELGRHQFSGIAATFGGETSELSVLHLGRELLSCVVPCGGNWIDRQLAVSTNAHYFTRDGEKRLAVDEQRRFKETLPGELPPAEYGEHSLGVVHAYEELLSRVVNEFSQVLEKSSAKAMVERGLPLIYTGGSSRIPGFDRMLRTAIQEAVPPLRVRSVTPGNLGEFTVARGCLIHAELEQPRVAA